MDRTRGEPPAMPKENDRDRKKVGVAHAPKDRDRQAGRKKSARSQDIRDFSRKHSSEPGNYPERGK
jgi:hypothetical protein